MAHLVRDEKSLSASAATVPTPTSAQVVALLRATFVKQRPSWWRVKLGLWEDYSYAIDVMREPIEPIFTGDLFRRHRLFHVYASDSFLQQAMLPGGCTYGLFAYDGVTLRYLSIETQAELETILRLEQPPLEQHDAKLLAELICEVLIDQRAHGNAVLADADALLHFGGEEPFDDYELNTDEWRKVQARIVRPTIVGDRSLGWLLSFTSIWGWMHETQELGVERWEVSGDYQLKRCERDVLTTKIFARTPAVLY